MSENYKEVYFDKYCQSCENEKTSEFEEPCDECLGYPYNVDTHKPKFWSEKKKKR